MKYSHSELPLTIIYPGPVEATPEIVELAANLALNGNKIKKGVFVSTDGRHSIGEMGGIWIKNTKDDLVNIAQIDPQWWADNAYRY